MEKKKNKRVELCVLATAECGDVGCGDLITWLSSEVTECIASIKCTRLKLTKWSLSTCFRVP